MQEGAMKTKLLSMFIVVAMLSVVSALSAFSAGPPIAKVRVVDLSALSSPMKLDDAELARLAALSAAENPEVFPFVSDFVLKSGAEVATGSDAAVACVLSCPIDISGSLKEEDKLEFVSMPPIDDAPKYDIAIVRPDGSVAKVDKEIIVDYRNRTLNTSEAITVGEGDVILTFVKEVKPIHFGQERPTSGNDRQPNDRPNDGPSTEPQ
jgi:hypothetical protein